MKNRIIFLFLILIFFFSLRTLGAPIIVCMEHLGIINSFDERIEKNFKGKKIEFAGIIEDYSEEIKMVKYVKEINSATIIINGKNIFKTSPEIRNGRTMVPINKDLPDVLEVSYKENKKNIILTKGNGQDVMVKVLVPLRPLLKALWSLIRGV